MSPQWCLSIVLRTSYRHQVMSYDTTYAFEGPHQACRDDFEDKNDITAYCSLFFLQIREVLGYGATHFTMLRMGSIDLARDNDWIVFTAQTRRSTSRSPRTAWRPCWRLTRPSWPSTKTRSTRSSRRSGSS